MHEFVQLFDDSPQEGPMTRQKVRELTHHVHDVRSDKGFIGLALRFLTESQQLFHHRDNKFILLLHSHAS